MEQIFLVVLLVMAAAGYLLVYYRRIGRGRSGCHCDLYKNLPGPGDRTCGTTRGDRPPKPAGPSTDEANRTSGPSEPPDPSA